MRTLLVFIAAILLSSTAAAQLQISLGFNLDRQPAWGPTGYDHVEYYYMPDIEVYYSVPLHRFYYNQGGRWISSSSLPSRYRGYDLYNSYKVVVNERSPWRNHGTYRDRYTSYRGRHDQEPIRDSRDSKYFVNRNHPQHNTWVRQQSRGNNGNHYGNGNNRNRNGNGNNGNGNGNGNNGNGNGNGNNGNGNGNGNNGNERGNKHGR